MKRYSQIFIVCFLAILPFNTQAQQWSKSKARDWYAGKDWPVGCNFIPSTAINQLEMWQAESFDSVTIDRELGYAESIGFNTVRVFLHHLAWQEDAVGFKKRVDEYLTIANKHHIYTVFVFFDDCWNATYHTGKQPEPKIGVHNSGWVRDPGKLIYEEQDTLYPILESYVKDVLNTFKNDPRILMWDLYNEPGNSANGRRTLPLLKMVFKWAREVNPSQPVTAGVWTKALPALRSFQLKHSDVITYHNYFKAPMHASAIKA
ncbi:MAG TPA: cellulase family glycosylhydrolase, partial [Chitinophagales bacterium]|nr:cellulase family glycosylhydrolase [Chitinophagales bacterium]